jgi:hypothetical protein
MNKKVAKKRVYKCIARNEREQFVCRYVILPNVARTGGSVY